MASFAAAAMRGAPQAQQGSPYARLADQAAELARNPPAVYVSSAIPGDFSAADRQQMVSVLVAETERVLASNGVRLGRQTIRPYTVDCVPAPGGASLSNQQYAFRVTAADAKAKAAFSASLRRCEFPAHNLSLSFRPLASLASFRALLVGYSPHLPVDDGLKDLLRTKHGWHVSEMRRVLNPDSRQTPLPTDKVTVWVSGDSPASWAEAPKEFTLGNTRVLIRYPGVAHLAAGPRSAPPPARPAPAAPHQPAAETGPSVAATTEAVVGESTASEPEAAEPQAAAAPEPAATTPAAAADTTTEPVAVDSSSAVDAPASAAAAAHGGAAAVSALVQSVEPSIGVQLSAAAINTERGAASPAADELLSGPSTPPVTRASPVTEAAVGCEVAGPPLPSPFVPRDEASLAVKRPRVATTPNSNSGAPSPLGPTPTASRAETPMYMDVGGSESESDGPEAAFSPTSTSPPPNAMLGDAGPSNGSQQ